MPLQLLTFGHDLETGQAACSHHIFLLECDPFPTVDVPATDKQVIHGMWMSFSFFVGHGG